MIKHKGTYPPNWPEVARQVKERAGWKCERCGHDNDRLTGHLLTVHHLDGDKSNCAPFNTAALCQRCHLVIQGKVDLFQDYLFEHSEWMRSHVEGRNLAIAEGMWP